MNACWRGVVSLGFALLLIACGGGGDAGPADGAARDSSEFGEVDAGEAGQPDGGSRMDAGGDAAVDCRGVGQPCREGLCRQGVCTFNEVQFDIGGPSDPIQGFDGGIETTAWHDGYCTPVEPTDQDPHPCDSDSEQDVCGPCGRCIEGQNISFCARNCMPSTDSNPCRFGYQCTLSSRTCQPGCTTDAECRVYRADTNENGRIDPYDPDDNPDGDHLVYDEQSDATCNLDTFRCEHGGSGGAEAGDPCTKDSQCEANGRCLSEAATDGVYTDGYCVKDGCDLEGVECAGQGVCDTTTLGFPVCLRPCEVGATEGDRFTHARDCREGYTCEHRAGAPASEGVCLPGNFNDVRSPNIGSACTDPSSCYSPYGLGACAEDFGRDGYCTLFGCNMEGIDGNLCGEGAVCGQTDDGQTTLCLEQCDAPSDCPAPLGCWDTGEGGVDTGGEKVCFPGCLRDEHCRTGERCMEGDCVGAPADAGVPGEG